MKTPRNQAKTARIDAPTPEAIRLARKRAGLTQAESARLVHVALRTWEDWESGRGAAHPGLWELFTIKTANHGLAVGESVTLANAPECVSSAFGARAVVIDHATR